MNKKLVALLAVATMGISVVGATPQTQFTKGETQVDLGAASVETKADGFKAAHKWNFDGNILLQRKKYFGFLAQFLVYFITTEVLRKMFFFGFIG